MSTAERLRELETELVVPEPTCVERLALKAGAKIVLEHPKIALYGLLLARPTMLVHYLSRPKKQRLLERMAVELGELSDEEVATLFEDGR